MKLFFKLAYMCLLGIMVTVIWYPVLHEMGHLFASVILGGTDINVQLFPVPFVSAMMTNPTKYHYTIVGLAGLVLPMTAFVCRPKRFTVWFINEIVKCNVVISWLLSTVAIVCMICGKEWCNEDIVTVVKMGIGCEMMWLAACAFFVVLCSVLLIRNRPLEKLERFF